MTCGWTGVCRPVSERYPLLITETCGHTHLYDEIWQKNHPFFAIFRQFLDNQPLFKENLPKKGPLFREFGAQKPTHMGGTYPYPQHVMYPPGLVPRYNIGDLVAIWYSGYFFLTLLENNKSAVFEATTYFFLFSAINQQPLVRLTQTRSQTLSWSLTY